MPSVDGLIHVSQIAENRIEKPEDVLQIGQVVDAQITDINWETKKISLSIRALLEALRPVEEAVPMPEEEKDPDAPVYSTEATEEEKAEAIAELVEETEE